MRFVLHPGHVISRHDRQIHYITADQLARLYRLRRDEYRVCEGCKASRPDRCRPAGEGEVSLSPRSRGDYLEHKAMACHG